MVEDFYDVVDALEDQKLEQYMDVSYSSWTSGPWVLMACSLSPVSSEEEEESRPSQRV